MKVTRRVLVAAGVGTCAVLQGCIIVGVSKDYPGSAESSLVSERDYEETSDTLATIRAGDSQSSVLGRFDDDVVTLLSTVNTPLGPRSVYKLSATNRRTGSSLTRYLVFVDGKLQTLTDRRPPETGEGTGSGASTGERP